MLVDHVRHYSPFVEQREAFNDCFAYSATHADDEHARERNALVLDQAPAAGLVGTHKGTRISSRESLALPAAAQAQARVQSDTELLEIALSRLVLEDDFGQNLLFLISTVPESVDLELRPRHTSFRLEAAAAWR